MEYFDEEILRARQKNLSSGNVISENNIILTLVPVNLFDDRIEVLIPNNFTNLPENLAKIKYPMEQRPNIIKSNSDTSVNFAYSLLPLEQSSTTEASDVTDFFYNVIKKMQPANRFIDKKNTNEGVLKYGYFDFISPGLDESTYTIMAFLIIDNKLLHAIFNCPASRRDMWKPVAIESLNNIKVITKEGEAN